MWTFRKSACAYKMYKA